MAERARLQLQTKSNGFCRLNLPSRCGRNTRNDGLPAVKFFLNGLEAVAP
jgi:hypothetical protein